MRASVSVFSCFSNKLLQTPRLNTNLSYNSGGQKSKISLTGLMSSCGHSCFLLEALGENSSPCLFQVCKFLCLHPPFSDGDSFLYSVCVCVCVHVFLHHRTCGIFPDQGSNQCPLHYEPSLNWTTRKSLLLLFSKPITLTSALVSVSPTLTFPLLTYMELCDFSEPTG